MALKGISFSWDKLKFDRLYATYLGMTPREQLFALGGSVLVVILVVVIPFIVASRSLSSLGRELEEGRKSFKQMTKQIENFHRAKAELTALEQTMTGGFDPAIASTLENLATKAGIQEKIDALKAKPQSPSDFIEQSSVDVRLKRVKLNELVGFLVDIENHPEKILRLENLDISPRYDNKQELDAAFTVSTFKLRTEEVVE
ncbi:MAG: type II secretion system protein M [Deltaproteobacteria bacterium]|nr:type II secretion system protein M [Deltaproteobacteria bacterium]